MRHKLVNPCCKDAAEYLDELPNDQRAVPGYRHIRINLAHRGMLGSPRIRFCPWCGFEFAEDTSKMGFWERCESVAARVNTWPASRRAGINMRETKTDD